MAEEIERLLVRIEANATQFENAIKKMNRSLHGAQRETRRTMAAIQESVDGASMGLRRSVLMATTALTTLGVSFGAAELVRNFREAEEAASRLQQVLNTTGHAAGLSFSQIETWARALEEETGRGSAEIQNAAAQLATFTSIGRREFLEAIEVANDMAAVFGGDLKSNLDAVARALDDPIEGFANLRKRGFALTEAELKRAEAHMKAGQYAAAQQVVLQNLSSQVDGAAAAVNTGITKALNDLQRQADDTFKTLADQGGTDAAIAALDLATKSVAFLAEHHEDLLQAAQVLAVFLASRYVVSMGLAATTMLSGAAAAVQAKTAVEALNAAMAKNPAAIVALAVAALSYGIIELDKRLKAARVASDDYVRSQDALKKATDAYAEAAGIAAGLTGKEAQAAKQAAAEKRRLAEDSLKAARAKLVEAQATITLIEAEAQRQLDLERRAPIRGDRPGSVRTIGRAQRDRLEIARENSKLLQAQIQETTAAIAEADRILNSGGPTPLEYDGDKPKKGKDAAKEAEQRRRALEDMKAEVDLQEAQLTNDLDRVRALEREAAVRSRTRALIDSGITKDTAAAAAQAEAMQKRIDEALLRQMEREGTEARRALDLELYRLEANHERVRVVEQEIEKQERITFWQEKGHDLVTATNMAMLDLVELENARTVAAQRTLTASRQQHELTIAQLSGNERLRKQLEDEAEIRERIERYRTEGRLSPDDARRRAVDEVTRERTAATYGEHRELFASAFSDGIRAAMSGDLQGFLSNQFGNFADTMFQKMGERIYDTIYGGVSAASDGVTQGTAMATTVGPAIVGAGATAAATMGSAITAAGAAAGGAMAAAIAGANAARLPMILPGFDKGGYTGPGPKNAPAGVVHKGEVVWSQKDVSRAGGVAAVEAMRKGLKGYDRGGPVSVIPSVNAAIHRLGQGVSRQVVDHRITVSPERDSFIALSQQAARPIATQAALQTTATGVAYSQDQQRTMARRRRQSLIG
jgi:hypothetical protein